MTDRLTAACRQTLRDWVAPSPDQDRLRGDVLALLATRVQAWSRSSAGTHLTASALICWPAGRQVLLTRHARIGRWLQTGGHVEPADADLAAAALREAQEESGLGAVRLDPVPLLLSRHEVPCGVVRPTFHLDVQFLAVTDRAAPPVVSAESSAVSWFDRDALPAVDDSVRDLVAAAGRRLGC